MTRVLVTAAMLLAPTVLGQGLNLLPDQMSAEQKKRYSDRARAFRGCLRPISSEYPCCPLHQAHNRWS
uniref:hypothetical protein n=1 Tax=Deinococcus sp. TaxID=47478 RepID=UPI0025C606D5